MSGQRCRSRGKRLARPGVSQGTPAAQPVGVGSSSWKGPAIRRRSGGRQSGQVGAPGGGTATSRSAPADIARQPPVVAAAVPQPGSPDRRGGPGHRCGRRSSGTPGSEPRRPPHPRSRAGRPGRPPARRQRCPAMTIRPRSTAEQSGQPLKCGVAVLEGRPDGVLGLPAGIRPPPLSRRARGRYRRHATSRPARRCPSA